MIEPDNARDRLDRLVTDHVADVTAYCRWRCRSDDDAQDAVSDVFLVAWRRLADVPEGDAGRIWLLATARRVIANERRSRSRHRRLVERLTATTPRGVTEWPADLAPGPVAETLRRLDPADREILLLAEWEGLSSAELGDVLGCLPVTARGRLHRARERFRTAYRQAEPGGRTASARATPRPAMTATPPGGIRRPHQG